MNANRFNKILVIDSIPSGELNTARQLVEDLKTYATAYAPSPLIEYVRAETGDDLIEKISHCRNDVLAQDIIPVLHIECHGNEYGFQLADGAFVDWAELKLHITELNVATKLNLMIAVAACTGGAIAKTVRMSDRAPFWGFIGPTMAISSEDLRKAYSTLYLKLLQTKSATKAFEAFAASTKTGLFWRMTAQGLFEKGWANYKEKHCIPKALDARGKRMQEQFKEKFPDKAPPTLEELRIRLINQEPEAFGKFRDTFFMYDLYPEHQNRFPVCYKP